MFLTPKLEARPMFPTRSRLAVVRDIAVLGLCLGIVVGFLIQIWQVPAPRAYSAPATLVASSAALL